MQCALLEEVYTHDWYVEVHGCVYVCLCADREVDVCT